MDQAGSFASNPVDAESHQQGHDGHHRQAHDRGVVRGSNRPEQRNSGSLELVAAGTVQGLVSGDVALDLLTRQDPHREFGCVEVFESPRLVVTGPEHAYGGMQSVGSPLEFEKLLNRPLGAARLVQAPIPEGANLVRADYHGVWRSRVDRFGLGSGQAPRRLRWRQARSVELCLIAVRRQGIEP